MGRWSHSGLQSQHLFEWLQMLGLFLYQEGAQTSGPLTRQYKKWSAFDSNERIKGAHALV